MDMDVGAQCAYRMFFVRPFGTAQHRASFHTMETDRHEYDTDGLEP